jgi:hypothetical protein
MAGIINMAINKADPLGNLKGYNAATAGFDEEKDTVEGRLNRLTNNSQLKTAAKGDALKFGSGRGMINSNMTAAAGVDAFYNRATPIASQDAAASLQSKQFDTGETNTGYQFSAGEVNKGSMLERQGQQQIEQISTQAAADEALQASKYGFENTLQTDRYGLETGLQTGLQVLRGTQETANIGQRGDIDKDLQTDADAAAADRLDTQGDQSIAQIDAKGLIDKGLQSDADTAAATRLATQGTQSIAQIDAKGLIDKGLQSDADTAAAARLTTQGTQSIAQIEAQGAENIELEGIRNTNETALQDLKNTNDRLISANGAAATLFSNSQIAISNILANPDMTTAAKQSLVNTITRELENGLTAIGTFSDVDVTELIGGNTPVGGDGGTDGGTDADGTKKNYDIPQNYNWSNFLNKDGNEDLAEAYASQTWADSPKQWAEELWVKQTSNGSDPRFMAEFGVATTS